MNKDVLRAIAAALVIMIIVTLLWDRQRWKQQANANADDRDKANDRNSRLLLENQIIRQQMNQMYADMVELQTALANGDSIENSVLAKLNELVGMYKDIDARVSNELVATMKLIEADEPMKATFTLAKVVENLLKEKYEHDPAFIARYGSRGVPFAHYLEHAEQNGVIGKDEYNFAKGLKEIRNQEAHEMDVKKDRSFVQTAMLFGIGLIAKLTLA
jgi:hypothetical protein